MRKLVSEREFALLLVAGSTDRYGLAVIPDDPGYVTLVLDTVFGSFELATRRGAPRRWRADTALRWLLESAPADAGNPVFVAELKS